MNPTKQRIAIAEACGFIHKTFARDVIELYHHEDWMDGQWVPDTLLPDYPNDLNAMHEAEKCREIEWYHEEYAQHLLNFIV